MSIIDTSQSQFTRGQARAIARALNRLADGDGPIDRLHLQNELKRVGFEDKTPAPAASRPLPSHDQLVADAKPKCRIAESLPPPTGPPPIWVRPRVGAQIAGVGLTLFYRWLNSKKVLSKRVGGVRLVSVASIHAIKADGEEFEP